MTRTEAKLANQILLENGRYIQQTLVVVTLTEITVVDYLWCSVLGAMKV